MIAYKWLRPGGAGIFTGFQWPLPDGGPASWVDARIRPCRSGIHACRAGDLPLWVGPVLYEIELGGEIVEEATKIVASRGRLLRRIDAWDGVREEYTRMCAARAHELATSVSPPLEDWDAVVEPSLPEGPALLGFIAARIAERLGGLEAYRAERDRQALWLVERLGVPG